MPQDTVRGFVLRTVPVGEHDRIIDILTRERGLITASARGSRRTKSPMLAATQDFALSEFGLFIRQGRVSVDRADLVQSFIELQSDLTRLVCAAHLSEVFLDCLRDDTDQPSLYTLWAYAMGALIDPGKDPLLMTQACAMRLMKLAGYEPRLDRCSRCNQDLPPYRFSFDDCGLICSRHLSADLTRNALPLTDGLLSLLRHSMQSPVERLFAFSAAEPVLSRFIQMADRYVCDRMDKRYHRLDLLQTSDHALECRVRTVESREDAP